MNTSRRSINPRRRSALGTYVLPVALGLCLPVALLYGCKKDDDAPPPLPSATAAATPAPPLELTPEDAGVDAPDGDGGKKKVGHGGGGSSMQACCSALMQNSKSAPPPTNMYLMQAAAACQAAVASGKDKSSVTAVISGLLRGAGMPTTCH